MMIVVVQSEAAVRESQHSVFVRALPGQQRGPARRACWSSIERLPEEHALPRQFLQIGSAHCVSVRLYIAARIMRVKVKNIGTLGSRTLGRGRSLRLVCHHAGSNGNVLDQSSPGALVTVHLVSIMESKP